MRGVDTNVLARYLTADDPRQYSLARGFFTSAEELLEPLYLTQITLCELVWVLSGRRYGFDRARMAELLADILDSRAFVIEGRTQVQAALAAFRTGDGDFSDYLIHRIHQDAGCRDTVTFDGALEAGRGFTLLGETDYPPISDGSDLIMEGP